MASYITLPQLAEKPGAVELAQVTAQPGLPPVAFAVLDVVLRGNDTSGFNPQDVDKAFQSVARIDEVVRDTQALIDGFLRQRGYKLPFNRVPRILTTWTRAIVRYYLHQHLITDEPKNPIARDYRDALRLLQMVAEGKFSLGLEDALTQAAGNPQAVAPERVFTLDTLRDY